MQVLGLFEIEVFIFQKLFFSFWNFTNHFFLLHFALKQKMKKSQFLYKNQTNPFGKMRIFGLF